VRNCFRDELMINEERFTQDELKKLWEIRKEYKAGKLSENGGKKG